MPLEPINKTYYYALQNRILRFNKAYGDRIKQHIGEGGLLSLDDFSAIKGAWLEIAERETGEIGATNLPDDYHIGEASFKILLDETKNLYNTFKSIVNRAYLGEDYVSDEGHKGTDYTYISSEILEIGLLALQTYTNVFEQFKKEERNGLYSATAKSRSKQLANILFGSENGLSKLGVDYYANIYLGMPIDNHLYDIRRNIYRNQESVEWFPDDEFKPKTNYYKVRKQKYKDIERDMQEKKDQKKREEEERRKEYEEKVRLEQEWKEQNKDLIAKQEYDEEQKDYDSVKNAFSHVNDVENPEGVDAVFYTYFNKFAERMGIDKSDLNAQSILNAASKVYVNEMVRKQTSGRIDNNAFLREMAPIYRQIQYIAYEAYVTKCATENRQMDMTVPAGEVSDLMGTLLYTMYPLQFADEKNTDIDVRLNHILQGSYDGGQDVMEAAVRQKAFDLVRDRFKVRDPMYFICDAEACYEAFTTEKKSSSRIVADTAALVNSYADMKKMRSEGAEYTANQEEHLKKEAMDAAYALEKRVETRYKSGWARFFRYISYSSQKEELARIKGILGIPAGERVADNIAKSRIDGIFVDTGDAKAYKKERTALATANRTEMKARLLANIEKDVGPLPEIKRHEMVEEEIKRVKISSEEPDEKFIEEQNEANNEPIEEKVDDISEEERKRLEEEKLEEEKRKKELAEKEERERKEKEEKERKEREEREERERKQREEKEREKFYENMRKEKEEEDKRILAEQKLFNERKEYLPSRLRNFREHLGELKRILNETKDKVEKLSREEEQRQTEKKNKLEYLKTSICSLEETAVEENVVATRTLAQLQTQYSDLSKKLADRRAEISDSKEGEKLAKQIAKENASIKAAKEKALKKAMKQSKDQPFDKTKFQFDETNKYQVQLEEMIESDSAVKDYKAQIFNTEQQIDAIERNTKERKRFIDQLRKEEKELLNEKEPVNMELESSKVFLDYMEKAVDDYEKNGEQYSWEGQQHIQYLNICKESPENPYFKSSMSRVENQIKEQTRDKFHFL